MQAQLWLSAFILNSDSYLSDFHITGAAVCAPFGIESAAIAATIVHPASEPVGDKSAQDENAAENGHCQQRVSQPLYFSPRLL